jgi:hypothetical protein
VAKSLKEKVLGTDDTGENPDPDPPTDAETDVETADATEADTTPEPDATEQSPDEFREAQLAQAREQNMTADNAVPEQRPQAFLQPPAPHSDLTQRLIEEGEINNDPMPASAFEKAASDAQMEQAADESRTPALHPGLVVKVTEGPHRDRIVAITRVISYQNDSDLARVTAGIPDARFVQPAEIEGRAIGDDRDGEILILVVEDAGLELQRDFKSLARR